jgi:hypothetical protein
MLAERTVTYPKRKVKVLNMIIIEYGKKHLIAEKRIGSDKEYIVIAEAKSAWGAEKLRKAIDRPY